MTVSRSKHARLFLNFKFLLLPVALHKRCSSLALCPCYKSSRWVVKYKTDYHVEEPVKDTYMFLHGIYSGICNTFKCQFLISSCAYMAHCLAEWRHCSVKTLDVIERKKMGEENGYVVKPLLETCRSRWWTWLTMAMLLIMSLFMRT